MGCDILVKRGLSHQLVVILRFYGGLWTGRLVSSGASTAHVKEAGLGLGEECCPDPAQGLYRCSYERGQVETRIPYAFLM